MPMTRNGTFHTKSIIQQRVSICRVRPQTNDITEQRKKLKKGKNKEEINAIIYFCLYNSITEMEIKRLC